MYFSKLSSTNRIYFGIFCLFCTINCYFEYRIQILCIFLYMGTCFKDMFQHLSRTNRKNPRSVNNSRTNYLLGIGGVLNGPITSLKHPSALNMWLHMVLQRRVAGNDLWPRCPRIILIHFCSFVNLSTSNFE